MHFAQLKTLGGYSNSEATSAMQKSIRRGLEEEALFWATELELAGYGGYVWKRLRIIASEDIGMADPNVCVQVRTLYENWLEQKKNKEDRSLAERLFLVHAILIVVRAKKSRMVDTALITFYEGEREKRKIPDVAWDMHTIKGRKMGRGVDHFFTEGATCANEVYFSLDPSEFNSYSVDGEDPYEARARNVRKRKRLPPAQMALVDK
jgi:replication-associated recombination protein RarA